MKKFIAVILSIIVGCAILTGCATEPTGQADTRTNSYGAEMRRTEQNHKKLSEGQPAPFIDSSVERSNLQERIKRWNDPGKVSYIYLLTKNGTIMSYHQIKGKVSSVNSMLTASTQLVADPNCFSSSSYGNCQSQQVESPDFDGSYGSNGDGIFFFTVDGTYVEWNGEYFLSDKPMQMTSKPVLIEINK